MVRRSGCAHAGDDSKLTSRPRIAVNDRKGTILLLMIAEAERSWRYHYGDEDGTACDAV
jgi:hypothetical protein